MSDYHLCGTGAVGTVRAATRHQLGNPNCLAQGRFNVTGPAAAEDPGRRRRISSSEAEAVTLGSPSDAGVGAEPRGDAARPAARFDSGTSGVEVEIADDGVTGAACPELLGEASTRATLDEDGGVTVCSAARHAGDRTGFVMTQIAADRLGVPTDRVRVHLGNGGHPDMPSPGKWRSVLMVGAAIDKACGALMVAIARRASEDLASPFFDMPLERLRVEAGRIMLRLFEDRMESWSDLAARWDDDPVAVAVIHLPTPEQ